MGYGAADPYYQPEKFGLETIATVDFGGSYEFDITVVWFHKESGNFYWARDSGCSCPSPFEDFRSLDDLGVLTDISQIDFGADNGTPEALFFLDTVSRALAGI